MIFSPLSWGMLISNSWDIDMYRWRATCIVFELLVLQGQFFHNWDTGHGEEEWLSSYCHSRLATSSTTGFSLPFQFIPSLVLVYNDGALCVTLHNLSRIHIDAIWILGIGVIIKLIPYIISARPSSVNCWMPFSVVVHLPEFNTRSPLKSYLSCMADKSHHQRVKDFVLFPIAHHWHFP